MIVKNEPNYGGKKEWEPVRAGSHVAYCYGMVDLGMQKNAFAKDEDGRDAYKREIMLVFEITDDKKKLEDGKEVPKILTKRMALSVLQSKQGVKSTLRKILEQWFGFTDEQFDEGIDLPAVVIGKPAIISVNHKQRREGEGVFEEIATISGIIPGMPVPAMESEAVVFEFPSVRGSEVIKMTDADRKKIIDQIEKLPKTFKIQAKVKESQTYELYKQEYPINDGTQLSMSEVTDELPFD